MKKERLAFEPLFGRARNSLLSVDTARFSLTTTQPTNHNETNRPLLECGIVDSVQKNFGAVAGVAQVFNKPRHALRSFFKPAADFASI